MACVLVNNWHCQYFYFSQSLFLRSKSLTTGSINWTWRSLCGFWTSEHLLLKCLAVPHLSFLVFMSLFMNSESGLEINGRSYVLILTVFTRNQVDNITAVTRQIASDILKPASNFTLKLIISYQVFFSFVQSFDGFRWENFLHIFIILINCFEWCYEC